MMTSFCINSLNLDSIDDSSYLGNDIDNFEVLFNKKIACITKQQSYLANQNK